MVAPLLLLGGFAAVAGSFATMWSKYQASARVVKGL
jgi:hypothetical protein